MFLRAIQWIMDYGFGLPLTLTMGSNSRVVRLFGLLCFAAWILPVGFILVFPLLFLLIAHTVEEFWESPMI